MVIGQEQDSRGAGFSATESYIGTITRMHIWDRVLTVPMVRELAGPCSQHIGNVRAWPDFLDGMYGRVQKIDSTYCTGNEYIFATFSYVWLME